jgi:hypothetical protein
LGQTCHTILIFVLIVVYVASAAFEVAGLLTIFNPSLKDTGRGTTIYLERRTGAWLIGVGIVIGLGGNIAALLLTN